MNALLGPVLLLAALTVGIALLVQWVRGDSFSGLPRTAARSTRERREPGRREATGLSNRVSAVAELGVSYRR